MWPVLKRPENQLVDVDELNYLAKWLGAIGHVRIDFGNSGNEFWHTWWPRGSEELNTSPFKEDLQQVMNRLREDVLKNRSAMERFCYEHGGKISGGWTQNYG